MLKSHAWKKYFSKYIYICTDYAEHIITITMILNSPMNALMLDKQLGFYGQNDLPTYIPTVLPVKQAS